MMHCMTLHELRVMVKGVEAPTHTGRKVAKLNQFSSAYELANFQIF